jgi:crotonobetainyl-CoA:carnitine CoA-transferase CaiB-like acyl-CoA transferase
MRPGVMARLGLAYRQLAVEHPALVYCSISAYGQRGHTPIAPGWTASCRPTPA